MRGIESDVKMKLLDAVLSFVKEFIEKSRLSRVGDAKGTQVLMTLLRQCWGGTASIGWTKRRES